MHSLHIKGERCSVSNNQTSNHSGFNISRYEHVTEAEYRNSQAACDQPRDISLLQSPLIIVIVSRQSVVFEECIWDKNSHILLQFGSIT
jgi:hypothetical protein